MKFLQLGKVIINLDHVLQIHLHEAFVSVVFTANFTDINGYQALEEMTFKGKEAKALRSYLKKMSGDLVYVALHETEAGDE